jgi:Uma2 family endonuclease
MNTEVEIQYSNPQTLVTLASVAHNNLAKLKPDNVTVLSPVSWNTFNQLLQELGDKRGKRLAYSGGVLEIMSPLGIHENNNRFIDDLIRVMADELGLELKKFGSLTLKRDKSQQGVEPDSCYYLQNEPLVRGKQSIDLTLDPPPDLVLEIDITKGSLDKLPIYANLSVPEVWRYDGSCLSVFILKPELSEYAQVEHSSIFPFFPPEQVPLLIKRSLAIGETSALREFRQWLKANVSDSDYFT